MAELDLRKSPWNEGLNISTDFMRHQLFHLNCIVYASPIFDAQSDNHRTLREEFQETEVGRLLLIIATAVRNAIDQNPRRARRATN